MQNAECKMQNGEEGDNDKVGWHGDIPDGLVCAGAKGLWRDGSARQAWWSGAAQGTE
ncbi:MAG: hypothetical protein ABSG78_12120 [Verrucomicrobiota bacterium]